MIRMNHHAALIISALVSIAAFASSDNEVNALNKHVTLLRKFCGSNCGRTIIDIEGFYKDNGAIAYQHELIRLTLKKITVTNTLLPIFECWDLFKRDYHLDEALFVHEYSMLLFLAYKNILVRFSPLKVSIADIIKLSAEIASLPLDQLLTALEHCYHQFMLLMNQYGMQPGITFAAWIRQYWWVPPVVLISMLYSIATHFLLGRPASGFDFPIGGGNDLNSLFGLGGNSNHLSRMVFQSLVKISSPRA